MKQAFAAAFEEWDRRYRADPGGFMSEGRRLLGETPSSYGDLAAATFVSILDDLAAGRPWNQIERATTT